MANFNFTKVIIGGRLTEVPELATTPDARAGIREGMEQGEEELPF